MDLNNLEKILKIEPKFRLAQAKEAVFKNLIESWAEAKNLPVFLREKLNQECPLLIQAKTFFSKDKKTVKALITLNDGLGVETVLMRHQNNRNTVCVSSQIGCPLGCLFCATGKMGFKRNLSSDEIIEQTLFFSRLLKPKKITNIVFMGMGEPFLNYENVLAAIRILNDKQGFNLGGRRFSISTAGIPEKIEKLAQEKLEINLAVSLHAPDDKLRSQIVPLNKKHPIKKLLAAVDDYLKQTRRKVMFEYLMIKGVNDSDECAEKLVRLMKSRLGVVNLISYNPTGVFKPSTKEQIKRFKEILEKAGISVTQRYGFGQDIEAACGQLAAKA